MVWDPATGEQLSVLRGHGGLVFVPAISPDDARVATASADGTARIWDARSGRSLLVLRSGGAIVNAVAFDPARGW